MVQKTGNQIDIPEWRLFRQAQEGDERAWGKIIERYRPGLETMVLMMTGSRAVTDDIIQETFLRSMHAEIGHFSGKVSGFLGTIAYRLAVKETRRAKRDGQATESSSALDQENALEVLIRSEEQRHLVETIKGLSEDHREVLMLRFYGDLSYEEISRLLEIPAGTIKSRVFYAIKTCRAKLKEKGIL